MKKLKKAYKKLDLQEYKNIVDEANGIIYNLHVYDWEQELIVTLHRHSEFKIVKHYCWNMFMGYNVYTRVDQTLILIDTFDCKAWARKLVRKLKKALQLGEVSFNLPY